MQMRDAANDRKMQDAFLQALERRVDRDPRGDAVLPTGRAPVVEIKQVLDAPGLQGHGGRPRSAVDAFLAPRRWRSRRAPWTRPQPPSRLHPPPLLSPLEHVHRETIGVNLAIHVGPKAIHLIALDTFDGHQWPS
jgi:hypothetical protein